MYAGERLNRNPTRALWLCFLRFTRIAMTRHDSATAAQLATLPPASRSILLSPELWSLLLAQLDSPRSSPTPLHLTLALSSRYHVASTSGTTATKNLKTLVVHAQQADHSHVKGLDEVRRV